MFKKILILVLIAAMLSLTSCKVVEVIDHGKKDSGSQEEYSPWGYWYSYDNSNVIELREDSDKVTLYFLNLGYYEYHRIDEVTYTRNEDVFTFVWEGETLTFIFDKFANTLTLSIEVNGTAQTAVYTPKNIAPQKHPEYSYPDYTKLDPYAYVAINDMDFSKITPQVFEGAPYDIAVEFYGSIGDIPALEKVSRPAQKGDCVNIDYCGKLDGVAFSGGTAQDVALFISDYKNGYIPGFTDGIIGHSVGETFDVNVTFPESYPNNPDLAGKAVVFTMTLNSICDLSISDEKVAEYSGNDFETYEEWLNSVRFDVTTSLASETIREAASKIEDLPESSYMYFYQQMLDYYHQLAYYYNIDYELIGLDEAAVLQEAINTAIYNMALYLIAEENEITWTNEDYTTKYETYVSNYLKNNSDATEEEARMYASEQITKIKHELTEEAVLAWTFHSIFPSDKE